MIIIDEDIRYNGEDYRAIAARGKSDEAYLHFLQPLESKLEYQESHEEAIETIDLEKDLAWNKITLEPKYEQ